MKSSFVHLLCLISLALAVPIPAPSPSLNSILFAIENMFPEISGSITEVSGLITDAEVALAALTGTSTTQNGLSGPCKDMTLIFARGTADPGNVGFLTGPPFFEALQKIIGSSALAVQGVPYAATVSGFFQGGDPEGGPAMAALVEQAFSQCPESKVVMAGYSQGGQIVHNAAALLPAETMEKVSAVVIFGDPNDGTLLTNTATSKMLTVCHEGDDICLHGDLILVPHLTYAENAEQAANFVAEQSGI